jgi:DNA-binding PadR family transcriptional regulator
MSNESLKGHLDTLLLAAVEHQAAHGYAIIERLRALSAGAFDLQEGTIYPALHRLERLGLLESDWSTEGGRKRRVYSVTTSGHKALAKQRQEWRAFSKGVNAVLQGAL